MYQITKQQKANVIAAIKHDGFMISGWCRRKKVDISLFYRVLGNNRGQAKNPSVKSDEIFQKLINDGYLPPEEKVLA